jgi:hypothetical protein
MAVQKKLPGFQCGPFWDSQYKQIVKFMVSFKETVQIKRLVTFVIAT